MAFNVGELVAKVSLDMAEFKKGIAEAKNATEGFANNANKIGKDLTSLGAKLSIAVGIPATLLAKSSVNSALEIESAWKRVQKVYDGTADSINNELMPSAKNLSIEFGKNKLEIIGVMEELAAMGNTGPQLIDKTRQALQFATNGGLELNEGLNAVIATSSILGVQGEELTKQLAKMNRAENAGSASMGDLAIAMSTVGNVAKFSGVTIDELNSFMSVLRQRGVEASEAANGLKTIFTRMQQPSETALEIMKKYGISIEETTQKTGTFTRVVGGNSEELKRLKKIYDNTQESIKNYETKVSGANLSDEKRAQKLDELKQKLSNVAIEIEKNQGVTEKYTGTQEVATGKIKDADVILKDVAESWNKMTDAERQELAFQLGTMFQKDKFLALMDDLNSTQSEYTKILEAQADETQNLNSYNNELSIFLDQSSTKVEQFRARWEEVQAVLGGVVVSVLLPLLNVLGQILNWFVGTDPLLQKIIAGFLMLGVVIGPMLIFFGMLIQALSFIIPAFVTFGAVLGAITLPVWVVIGALIALIATGVLLWQNWDVVTAHLSSAWNIIKTKFTDGVEWVKTKINELIGFFASKVGEFRSWGANIGGAFLDGFRDKLNQIKQAAIDAFNSAKDFLKGNSPPKDGPFKNIDVWGENIGLAWVEGMKKGLASLDPNIFTQSNLGFNTMGAGGGNNTNIVQNITANLSDQLDVTNLSEKLGFEMLRRS